jgi:hypothetical protein
MSNKTSTNHHQKQLEHLGDEVPNGISPVFTWVILRSRTRKKLHLQLLLLWTRGADLLSSTHSGQPRRRREESRRKDDSQKRGWREKAEKEKRTLPLRVLSSGLKNRKIITPRGPAYSLRSRSLLILSQGDGTMI